jgi:hypothetical protein
MNTRAIVASADFRPRLQAEESSQNEVGVLHVAPEDLIRAFRIAPEDLICAFRIAPEDQIRAFRIAAEDLVCVFHGASDNVVHAIDCVSKGISERRRSGYGK